MYSNQYLLHLIPLINNATRHKGQGFQTKRESFYFQPYADFKLKKGNYIDVLALDIFLLYTAVLYSGT